MMKRFGILLFLCFLSLFGYSETIKISIFNGIPISNINCKIETGKYQLIIDGQIVCDINKNQTIKIKGKSSKSSVIVNDKEYSGFKIVLNTIEINSDFNLNGTIGRRSFHDNLIIKSKNSKLLFINEINVDKYVAGVVSAEVGNNRPPEYYKVQAIISRTYALANKHKHATEGFHLCDKTHCQVYHGISSNTDILNASKKTSNYVLTDHNIDLITAVFHSNCGGQTVNSDKVWSKPLPYLMGVKDTFCLKMPNSHWEKKIDKSEWIEYLSSKGVDIEENSADLKDQIAHFPESKILLFDEENSKIKNTEIRADWNLKSAWFHTYMENDQVVFTGRGFGHGVGICQEGAIRMSSLGYSYSEILHFYYNDIHLIDLNYLDFFKE